MNTEKALDIMREAVELCPGAEWGSAGSYLANRVEELEAAVKPRSMDEAPENVYVLVKADGAWREGIIEDGACWQCPAGGGVLEPVAWRPLPAREDSTPNPGNVPERGDS